jgi:Predicted Zn-dependent peptidases
MMRGYLIALLVALAPASLAAREPVVTEGVRWAFEKSDIPVDPGFRFGRLTNGMRYIIRHNTRPAATALVRMNVDAGSLDEKDDERGFAHFVEHMAFNGSTKVPEGEMVRLLERHGLAFGADTNASTSFENTLYKLDLPRSDSALLDTAIMLMRETASNLTISASAVERERGVVLSEMRDRNSWGFRNAVDAVQFFYPRSLYSQRFPIGTADTVANASADRLRKFYEREYVPSQVTLVVVGDFDPQQVETLISKHFGDWQARQAESQPDAGPVDRRDRKRTAIYVDSAVSERVTIQRNGAYLDRPDSAAQRRQNLLAQIGYDILNRRLQRLSRSASAPFRGAGFGTGDVFETARATRLIIDTIDGKWEEGLVAAAVEYRRALKFGFTDSEVAEQLASIRSAMKDAVSSSRTRTNSALTQAALTLVNEDLVPSTPASILMRFEKFAPAITPAVVKAAMEKEAVQLDRPLIRFEGRRPPAGGAKAIRAAWGKAERAKLSPLDGGEVSSFGYTDFGIPGSVSSDSRETVLGIRKIRFANGVMLNLKRTEIEDGKVRLSLALDGGDMLDTKDNPIASEMAPYLDEGGLGKHSRDELDTVLAGRTLGFGLSRAESTFTSSVQTTPMDLELQLQLLAALISDPGYRLEGEVQYRQSINNYFAQLRATPSVALQAQIGAILSDNDPRFSLQKVEDYRHLSYAKLQSDIGDRLARGAIEIGIVGDFDEAEAIDFVARTFGALPQREDAFLGNREQPPRMFTSDRSPRAIHHTGPSDQALLRITWPTRDDSDPIDELRLELLEKVMRIELSDELRETLGKAYSPSASSFQSRHWSGYGTFSITASVDVADVSVARSAIARVVSNLATAPVSEDTLRRARQPMLESLQNALKSNLGWLSLVDRAQSEPDRIERFLQAGGRLRALGAADIQQMARRYIIPGKGVEVVVLPEGVTPPG